MLKFASNFTELYINCLIVGKFIGAEGFLFVLFEMYTLRILLQTLD